jgi:hypothetical protein
MFLDGIKEYVKEITTMSETRNQRIWVAVRVQRGFVSDIRAYRDEASARSRERSWRRQMNPDYDETGVSAVRINKGRAPARS